MTDGSFRWFLRRSLATLEQESPAGYAAMVAALGQRDVEVEVDGDRFGIRGAAQRLVIVDRVLRPVTHARGTRTALLAILQGEHSLESAVLAEVIQLRGALPDLVAFYEALRSYFNAAVRCPSFAALLTEYFTAREPLPLPE